MTTRAETSSLIAGKTVAGHRGLGLTGAVIRADTATGTHGPGVLYNDWDSAADDAKEFRGLILTPPGAGSFFAYEDGSFSLSGAPDGSYSFIYRLFVDGADLGPATATITVGVATATAVVSGAQSTASAGTVSATGGALAYLNGSQSQALTGLVSASSASGSATAQVVGSSSTALAGFILAVGDTPPVVSPVVPILGVLLDQSIEGVSVPSQGQVMTAITRKRGDTYAEQITVRNQLTGAAINITGCSFLLTIDPAKAPENADANVLQTAGQIVDAAGGVVKFPISPSQADHVGKFYFDIQMTDAEGKVRTIMADRFVFTQDITKN